MTNDVTNTRATQHDIVDRLRSWRLDGDGDDDMPRHLYRDLSDAANEIERLRGIIEDQDEQIHSEWGVGPMGPPSWHPDDPTYGRDRQA